MNPVPTIGEIRLFGGDFAPQQWAFCDGQELQITEYTALFSLLETTYGGDGRITFALPDLRGRTPVHPGQGLGLTNRVRGENFGTSTNTLTVQQLASHNHTVSPTTFKPLGIDEKDNSSTPEGNHPSKTTDAGNPIYNNIPNIDMAQQNIGLGTENTGQGQPFDNVQPTLALRYIIALKGIYPSRP